MALNISKTNFMLFKGKKGIVSPPRVVMNDTQISQIRKTKFLGIILDDKLSWVHHIDYISKKISKSIGIIYRLRQYLDKISLVSMYYAFIYPYLHYCNEVWGNAYSTNLNR